MEDTTSPNPTNAVRPDEITRTLRRHRGEMEAFLSANRQRFSDAHAELTGRLQRMLRDLADVQADVQRTRQEQTTRAEQLSLEAERINELTRELKSTRDEWSEARHLATTQQNEIAERIRAEQDQLSLRIVELTERQSQVAEAEARLRQREASLILLQPQLDEEKKKLAASRTALDARLRELEVEQQQIGARRAETEQQRQRIARAFEEQRLDRQREWERMRRDVEQLATEQLSRLDEELTTTRRQCRDLELRLNEAGNEKARLEEELAAARKTCAALENDRIARPAAEYSGDAASREMLDADRRALLEQFGAAQDHATEQQRELAETLRARNEELASRLEELASRHAEVAEETARLHQEQEQLEQARQALAEERRELNAARQAVDADSAEVLSRRRELDARRADTEEQRRRIARKLDENRRSWTRELEIKQAEIEQLATDQLAELRHKLSSFEDHCRELESRLGEAAKRESRLEEEVAAARQTCARLESERIESLAGDMPEDAASREAREAERRSLLEQLSAVQERATAQQRELAQQLQAQQDQLTKRLDELNTRHAEVAEETARLRQGQEQLSLAQRQIGKEQRKLDETLQAAETDKQKLVAERRELDARRADTEEQRRRIARKLDENRRSWTRELEIKQAEIEQLATDQLAELRHKLSSFEDHCRELESRLGEAAKRESRLEEEVAAARQTCARLEKELAERPARPTAGEDEACRALESERDALIARLSEADERLDELQKQLAEVETGSRSGESRDDFKSRYEMAMEDLRELKKSNRDLEEQLAKVRQGGALSASSETGLDWETQKKRLLNALENLDEDDEETAAERIQIDEIIRMTDAAMADKEEELIELRQLLEQRQGIESAGSREVIETILDQDAVIQEERANLLRRQEELKAALRQAEVEISIERAEIARQRQEVEEIMRQFAEDSLRAAADRETDGNTKTAEGSTGRRWLARLGINKQDGGPTSDY